MKILFYINPLVANGDPMFFLGSVRHKILPLARACKKIGHAVSLVIPDHLEPFVEESDISMIVIDTMKLRRCIHLHGELDFHVYRSKSDECLIQNAGKFFPEAPPPPPI